MKGGRRLRLETCFRQVLFNTRVEAPFSSCQNVSISPLSLSRYAVDENKLKNQNSALSFKESVLSSRIVIFVDK